jgi:ribosomal protein S27E
MDVEHFKRIMWDGFVDVDCTDCDHAERIEPDGDYPCTECADGRLVSPLVEAGLI